MRCVRLLLPSLILLYPLLPPQALHQLDSFRSLILLQGATKEEVEAWLCHLPTTYPAWAALMGWFLTLTSKMTGER